MPNVNEAVAVCRRFIRKEELCFHTEFLLDTYFVVSRRFTRTCTTSRERYLNAVRDANGYNNRKGNQKWCDPNVESPPPADHTFTRRCARNLYACVPRT